MNSGALRISSRASALLFGMAAFWQAAPAWACPSCTTRGNGGSMVPIVLGAMILTPYVVTTVVLRVIRKAEAERAREEQQAASAAPPITAIPNTH